MTITNSDNIKAIVAYIKDYDKYDKPGKPEWKIEEFKSVTVENANNYGKVFLGLGAKTVDFYENPTKRDFRRIFDCEVAPFKMRNEGKNAVLLFAYIGHGVNTEKGSAVVLNKPREATNKEKYFYL